MGVTNAIFMPIDRPLNHIENRFPKKRYAEEIYDELPDIEAGVDIQRVNATLLVGGKDTKIKLSAGDRLSREGWDIDQVSGAKVGSLMQHRNGDIYEVTGFNNREKKLRIRHTEETGIDGVIFAAPITLNAHEYDYRISDQLGNSKKIRVYDTVIKQRDLRTAEFINAIVSAIPADCMEVFDEIQIHTQNTKSGSFRAEPSLTSERRILNLFVSEDLKYTNEEEFPTKDAIDTLYHELGHAIVKYLKGSTHPGKKWRQIMDASSNEISVYASKTRYSRRKGSKDDDKGEVEDIADSFRLYFGTDGAKVEQARKLREFASPRFEKLDEIMEDLAEMRRRSSVSKLFNRPRNSLNK